MKWNPKAKRWQLQEAKAKLSRLVKDSQHAPQVITVHGEDVAVIQSIKNFQKQQNESRSRHHPNLFEALLKCPPGPPLKIDRDPNDTVGAGSRRIFD